MPAIAVLTGDLIGSTEAGSVAVARALDVIARTSEDTAIWPGGIPGRFTRHRGDGWQMLVAPPAWSLRAAVLISARLRATPDTPQTRIAIGFGPAESLGTSNLSDAHGGAFENSGRALEHLRRDMRLTIGGQGLTPLHWAVLDLLDERMSRWSAEQAEATALALDPAQPTQAEIATRLGISSQAVSYRLGGAGANAIRRALHGWEQSIEGDQA